MRIAHVTAAFPPYFSGTGNVCFQNCQELAHGGNDVHVFTPAIPGSPENGTLEGISVHRLHPRVRIGNAAFLPQLANLSGFDVIHLHYPFFGGELAAFSSQKAHTPLVITYHQDVLLTGAAAWIEKILRRTSSRYVLRSADRLLFTSLDYGQASYIRPLLKGREDRIGELPNGVDTLKFSPGKAPDDLVEYFKPGLRRPTALLVATLDRPHYFKGVNVFLNALARLPDHYQGIIVGSGSLQPSYKAYAQSLELDGRVLFAGRVPEADLPNYYRLADVVVLPSTTMGEAFGLVLVEGMACGKPVIASNLPGVRSVVEEGVTGFLVEPGQITGLANAVDWVLSNPQRAAVMGQQGRARVIAKYDQARIGIQLGKLYADILAHRDTRLADQ